MKVLLLERVTWTEGQSQQTCGRQFFLEWAGLAFREFMLPDMTARNSCMAPALIEITIEKLKLVRDWNKRGSAKTQKGLNRLLEGYRSGVILPGGPPPGKSF
jgi:hypothetical protein